MRQRSPCALRRSSVRFARPLRAPQRFARLPYCLLRLEWISGGRGAGKTARLAAMPELQRIVGGETYCVLTSPGAESSKNVGVYASRGREFGCCAAGRNSLVWRNGALCRAAAMQHQCLFRARRPAKAQGRARPGYRRPLRRRRGSCARRRARPSARRPPARLARRPRTRTASQRSRSAGRAQTMPPRR
ncbi:hypothetical protein D3C72_1754270 [compost metagenome]